MLSKTLVLWKAKAENVHGTRNAIINLLNWKLGLWQLVCVLFLLLFKSTNNWLLINHYKYFNIFTITVEWNNRFSELHCSPPVTQQLWQTNDNEYNVMIASMLQHYIKMYIRQVFCLLGSAIALQQVLY